MHFNICPWPECGSFEISPSDTLLIAGLAAIALTLYKVYQNYQNGMPLP